MPCRNVVGCCYTAECPTCLPLGTLARVISKPSLDTGSGYGARSSHMHRKHFQIVYFACRAKPSGRGAYIIIAYHARIHWLHFRRRVLSKLPLPSCSGFRCTLRVIYRVLLRDCNERYVVFTRDGYQSWGLPANGTRIGRSRLF